MSRINDQSSIEQDHILCFLSNVKICLDVSKSKPGSIIIIPSNKNGQIPIGQFVSVLINNDRELSSMISAWLETISKSTIQKQ